MTAVDLDELFRPWHGGECGTRHRDAMTLQTITYGRIAAAASPRRFDLAEDLDQRALEDPERAFVVLMCCCARDILTGHLQATADDAEE